jgi:4-hydroxy-tetrahydrodipicolinate synthase
MDHSLAGLYVPLITPLRSSGELAVDALEALAHSVIDAGAAGLVALGTTAEAATLSARERSATLVAGAGSNDTHASAQALRDLAAWPEVSAALTVVPYFTRPSEEGVIAHFTRLAAESPRPLIVYNVPGRTGQVVGWRALRKLAGLAGIIGVKHAVGGIDEDTVKLMADLPDGFAVLGGDDVFASPILALGAAGAILASAHLCTGHFAEMVHSWRAGEPARARMLGHRLAGLSAALFAEPNPTVIKAALHAQGRIPSPAVRLPLLAASPAAADAALRHASELAQIPPRQPGLRPVPAP